MAKYFRFKDKKQKTKKEASLGPYERRVTDISSQEGTPFERDKPFDFSDLYKKPSVRVTPDFKDDSRMEELIDELLHLAVEKGASDIHINGDDLEILFRVDGVLDSLDSCFSLEESLENFFLKLISKLKLLANIDIAEKRLPQDGAFTRYMDDLLSGKRFQMFFRVGTLPGIDRESVTVRVLNPENYQMPMELLGLSDATINFAERTIQVQTSHKMIVVTGRTGHGKTTTEYALVQLIRDKAKRIKGGRISVNTVEDPIEYRIPEVRQTQIKPIIGLGFEAILKAILRNDPDVILIGEVRDSETLQAAVHAAQTGHYVICTVHSSDAISALGRLIGIGASPKELAQNIKGIIAQVLVRRICQNCALQEYTPPKELLKELYGEHLPEYPFYKASGCSECIGGYRHRTAINEIFIPSPKTRQLIANIANETDTAWDDVRRQALQDGFVPMRQEAIRKIETGITTVEEVLFWVP